LDIQDESQSWTTKDATILLLIFGVFSTMLCIGFCVVVYFVNDFLRDSDLTARQPTPTASIALLPCPVMPTAWVEVMDDKFGPNVHVWPLGTKTDEYADSNIEIKNGALRFSMKAHQDFYTNYNPEYVGSQQDFYLLARVRQTGGSPDNGYGITFRLMDWNHYYFGINGRGEFMIYKNEDSSWEILDRMVSSSIQPGEYNELIVLAQGSQFTFCVNQKIVSEINDDSHVSGKVGIGMNLEQSADETLVEYDNFTVYAPK
jgi:hypothetical protein